EALGLCCPHLAARGAVNPVGHLLTSPPALPFWLLPWLPVSTRRRGRGDVPDRFCAQPVTASTGPMSMARWGGMAFAMKCPPGQGCAYVGRVTTPDRTHVFYGPRRRWRPARGHVPQRAAERYPGQPGGASLGLGGAFPSAGPLPQVEKGSRRVPLFQL